MEEGKINYTMNVKDSMLSFKRESTRDSRELIYDRSTCIGCWMCYDACPVEAIEKNPVTKRRNGKVEYPSIVIDSEKCVLCGICAEVCLFNSLDMTINGGSVKKLEYPKYAKNWSIDEKKCKPKGDIVCDDCEKACATEAIKCSLKSNKNIVERDEWKCIMCTTCAKICPEEAITGGKIFDGEIELDLEKCQSCGLCVELCPSNALTMPKPEIGRRVDKLVLDKDVCIYCGACANACATKALEVHRGGVRYTDAGERAGAYRRREILECLKEAGNWTSNSR
ncbi:MAG: 4Fe-4S binding protein [Candidatus Hydrothermarchaeaceae archaeon]